MLNEFLIFTAIILLPINAILIDHVSVRREILARIEKPVRLSQYSEKMIGAFNRVSLSALGANSAFSGMFSNTGEKVDILIHRGNNDVASGCFIAPPPTRGRSFLEELFLKEENRVFGATKEPVDWDSCTTDILGDIDRACEILKNQRYIPTTITEMKTGLCKTCGQHITGSRFVDGGDFKPSFDEPCRTCQHNNSSDMGFPCSKCTHNANCER